MNASARPRAPRSRALPCGAARRRRRRRVASGSRPRRSWSPSCRSVGPYMRNMSGIPGTASPCQACGRSLHTSSSADRRVQRFASARRTPACGSPCRRSAPRARPHARRPGRCRTRSPGHTAGDDVHIGGRERRTPSLLSSTRLDPICTSARACGAARHRETWRRRCAR